MHLTRRGYALVGIVVGAELLAITYGARAINAIAAPAVIALVVSAVQVNRTERPAVERAPIRPGFPGDTREVTVDVDGDRVATVVDRIPGTITADPAVADEQGAVTVESTLPTTFSYAIRLEERGRHEFRPVVVRVSDVLGLVGERYELPADTTVLVYPPVYQVAGRETLLREIVDHNAVERHEFESVREYVPGDPLRNVHWKSTAKDPEEMYVTEFVDRRIEDTVILAASCEGDNADAMATAAASVAVMAIEEGVGVELRTPSGVLPMGTGTAHRDRILQALALTEGGWPEESVMEDADVHVHADGDGVTLELGTRVHTLEELTVSRANPLASREVSV